MPVAATAALPTRRGGRDGGGPAQGGRGPGEGAARRQNGVPGSGGARRWCALRPRLPPTPRSGRPQLPSALAVPLRPRPPLSWASSPFALSCVPLPPALSSLAVTRRLPLGARSLEGAIPRSSGSRFDRQRAASARVLRTAAWTAQCRGESPPESTWVHCCTSFLLAGREQGSGLRRPCPEWWHGKSPGSGQKPVLGPGWV